MNSPAPRKLPCFNLWRTSQSTRPIVTQAYRIAVVSTVAPFEYVYILWASLVGYLIFADVPGPRTMIGGAVIVVSGCYIILRKRELRRRAAVAAVDTG